MSVIDPNGVTQRPPPQLRRIPDRELRQARRALVEAAIKFLERCRSEGLVTKEQVSTAVSEFAE